MHVLLQFLVEAALLSLIGGGAGVLFGLASSTAIAALAHWPTRVSVVAIKTTCATPSPAVANAFATSGRGSGLSSFKRLRVASLA